MNTAQKQKAIFNWSGGKDSSLALYHTLKDKQFEIVSLLTTVNSANNRISMHGVRVELPEQQAKSIGLPLHKLMLPEMPDMNIYNQAMSDTVEHFKKQGITHSIFGDIFLEDLKAYRQQQLMKAGLQGHFPIWKRESRELMQEFFDLGFKAVLVCVNEKYLDRSFAGRLLDEALLRELPAKVDACGENGEYHSFVFDGPIFSKPINIVTGEVVYRKYKGADDGGYDTGFFYCDILPA